MACPPESQASTSTILAPLEPTPRPKMRIVEKPPQGGRPKKAQTLALERIVDSFACEAQPIASGSRTAVEQSTTHRALRPLPCIPQPQTAPPTRSCDDPFRANTTTGSTRPKTGVPTAKIRPLPPTPVPAPLVIRKKNSGGTTAVVRARASAPALLSPPRPQEQDPSPPPLPPQLVPPLLLSSAAPAASSTAPSTPPSPPSPPLPPLPPRSPTPGEDEEMGNERATELLEELKRDPNRHQQLILLAASLSRMSPGEIEEAPRPPKLSLVPVPLDTVAEEDKSPSSTLSSPVEFLNDLGPSKRYTVLSILTTLTDSWPDSESEGEEDGVYVQDGLGEKKKNGDLSWEFAVKTGAAISAQAKILTRFSKKWVREKKGRRWVEDDYSNVLSFLRRL